MLCSNDKWNCCIKGFILNISADLEENCFLKGLLAIQQLNTITGIAVIRLHVIEIDYDFRNIKKEFSIQFLEIDRNKITFENQYMKV